MITIITHENIAFQNVFLPESEKMHKKIDSLDMWNVEEATAHVGQFWTFPQGKKFYSSSTSVSEQPSGSPDSYQQLSHKVYMWVFGGEVS